MKEVTEYAPGTFCWVELTTSDAEGAKKFYTGLFDWQVQDTPAGEGITYTLLQIDGKDVAALYQMDPQQKSQGTPPNWLSYINVESVEPAMEKVKSNGGNVLSGPIDVWDLGRLAVLQDPLGAVFAVWQARKHIGARYVNQPRTFCWNELMTTDDVKAGEFYSKVFGWGREIMPESPAPSPYTVFQNENRPAGGMMKITKEMGNMPPHWIVYFGVEDCDRSADRVKQLGGSVMVPPTDIPNIGRFSILIDPQGADFAIIKMVMPA
jgi:uncharacterized protein